ncbi:MAG: hypothetical protein QW290_07690 [Sulfolobales archaeon]
MARTRVGRYYRTTIPQGGPQAPGAEGERRGRVGLREWSSLCQEGSW